MSLRTKCEYFLLYHHGNGTLSIKVARLFLSNTCMLQLYMHASVHVNYMYMHMAMHVDIQYTCKICSNSIAHNTHIGHLNLLHVRI